MWGHGLVLEWLHPGWSHPSCEHPDENSQQILGCTILHSTTLFKQQHCCGSKNVAMISWQLPPRPGHPTMASRKSCCYWYIHLPVRNISECWNRVLIIDGHDHYHEPLSTIIMDNWQWLVANHHDFGQTLYSNSLSLTMKQLAIPARTTQSSPHWDALPCLASASEKWRRFASADAATVPWRLSFWRLILDSIVAVSLAYSPYLDTYRHRLKILH